MKLPIPEDGGDLLREEDAWPKGEPMGIDCSPGGGADLGGQTELRPSWNDSNVRLQSDIIIFLGQGQLLIHILL